MDAVTFFDLIQRGAYATYPLIACSILGLAIAAERLWALRGLLAGMRELAAKVSFPLKRGDLDEVEHLVEREGERMPLAPIYRAVLPLVNDSPLEDIAEAAETQRLEQVQRLRRNVWMLGTVATASPFIGLFGTVIGIIKAFHEMASQGTGGFAVVAAGISEALVATALGLGVAILAVVAYNYLQVRLGEVATGMRVGITRFVESVRAGRHERGRRQVA